jgi:hypothetical protein
MRMLSALVPGNPIGQLLDGLLGAAGLITAQQARHALGRLIPQFKTMDPTLVSVTDAGLSMILGGVVQALSPVGGAIAQPWSTTAISIAQIDLVTRLTGMDLSAPLLAEPSDAILTDPAAGNAEDMHYLNTRRSDRDVATVGVGAIDYTGGRTTAPGVDARNIAGVV